MLKKIAVLGVGAIGSLVGGRLTGRVPAAVLRRGFGVLVLAVAVLVLAEQLPLAALTAALPWIAALGAVLILTIAALRLRRRADAAGNGRGGEPATRLR